MAQLTIRCHPLVPVETEELERWLDLEVHELRADAPEGTIRLSRLTQALKTADLNIGWLLELDLPEGQPLLSQDRLAEVLRDMHLLGLQPTVLTPVDPSELSREDDSALVSSPALSNGGRP